MSRVGKKPIIIPKDVEIKITSMALDNDQDSKGSQRMTVMVKGAKGSLVVDIPKGIEVTQKDDQLIFIAKKSEDQTSKALWGLARSLVNNAVVGVTDGFSKTLEINGVGYKAVLNGKKLVLNVGFSHPVEYNISEGITITVDKNQITITGIDKQSVGQTAAEIRNIKKPEPYKGKGIKYIDEVIRRKAGKVVKSE
ncbi:MAG: 50S ribosomal protein L6 [Candidatus Komeilibacteria bacterium CG11_big_fil_rev_8_21_14_0_20_36_20]|uniref:Large ribosomal subunit protein uL6 n=1 Tax=Candidatus Komeilibacteria bacterium CG11_big_fil_rev_8_21_14_0_20_36_20 TaxID=1974477 RepID=A0A2H0NDP0_9BACT|nr:MAG: 50S ribosomal protein L6 [Candidatus Komeilibacteria bacterium CG11_big_fil_rev_8_21_14_0_20_36_20]PIR81391.1 MAG: 50S ribosomal protein L6 [Candidatus Komeilibacteria bacterium CG10_big_fil_rev_8_21_14_0_10_36_65]PJC55116.1 MAG: 50S ribosomal protein L6 [Candidatus Komeilibacteria bacterium CG_4_9_14_0_2_um_filter_36_13]